MNRIFLIALIGSLGLPVSGCGDVAKRGIHAIKKAKDSPVASAVGKYSLEVGKNALVETAGKKTDELKASPKDKKKRDAKKRAKKRTR